MPLFRTCILAVGVMGVFALHALCAPVCLAEAAVADALAESGTVLLTVSEASVLVTVDGLVKGVTPLEAPLTLAVGVHRLELFKAGFVRVAQDMKVTSGAQSLSFQLQAEVRVAQLSVGATLLPASLLLDGRDVGPLPWSGEVPPGEHTVSARGAGAASAEQRVSVQAGERAVVTLTMNERPAQLRVQVEDASIFVDDKWVGVGAFEGTVPPGSHHLRLKRIGYAAKDYAVTLAPGEAWNVSNISWGEPNARVTDDSVRPVFSGMYTQVALLGLFSQLPTDELKQDCPAARTGGSCEWHRSYGGGLGVRVGYSFGWVALEGLGLATADGWYNEARYDVASSAAQSEFYGPPRSERYTFARYGGGLGVGARLLSPTSGVRATLGATIGFLHRWERYFRVSSTVTKVVTPTGTTAKIPDARADSSDVDNDTSGLFVADAGVLFGSTPGFKFQLGFLLAATFGSQSRVGPEHGTLGRDPTTGVGVPWGSGAVDVSRGTQLFFGPTLGVQLGH